MEVLSLLTFRTEEEAISLSNDTEYGLAAYAATSDARRMQGLARDPEAGIIALVGTLDSNPGGSFLGVEPVRQSGLGIEGGAAGLAAYIGDFACIHDVLGGIRQKAVEVVCAPDLSLHGCARAKPMRTKPRIEIKASD